MEDNNGTNKKQ